MKKYYIFAGLVLLAASPSFAQTKIGAAGAPDGSAMLEVTSGVANNKGLLLPRMTTVQRNAITSPAKGLMIYNTTTNQAEINNGTPALPVWAAATATATGWATTGNAGTTPATNFIGTTDNQPLTLRTNNTEKVRVTAAGDVGIGTNAPAAKLHVDTGGLRISNGATALARPAIEVINDGGGIGNNDNIVISSYGASTRPSIGTFTARGTASAPVNSQAGDNIGNFYFNAQVNGASTNQNIISSAYLGDGTTNKSKMVIYTSNTPQVTIDSSGFVGIGTRNPIAKLHVDTGGLIITNGTTALANPAIQVVNNGGGPGNNDNIVINSFGTNTQPSIGTQSSRGTFSTPENSQAGDNIGNFFFNSRVNGSVANSNVIRGVYLGDGTTNKSRLNFFTSNALQMTIDSNGFVGIGTTVPQQDLHVAGTARITGSSGTATTIAGRNAAGDVSNVAVGAGLSLTGGTLTATAGGNNWGLTGNTGTTPATNFIGTTDNQPLVVRTNNTEKVRVAPSGNVGIGSSTPDVRLHVADTGDATIRVGSTTGGRASVNLGLGNKFHGIVRNLTGSGGGVNDVALYTASGPASPGSIHLAASPTATDNLDLTQFVLKNTGNVGIGTNNPTAKLHVDTGGLRISNGPTALSNSAITVINDGGGQGNNDNIVIESYGANTLPSIGTFVARGTASAPQNSQAGDNIGNFQFSARVNGGQGIQSRLSATYLGDGTTQKSNMAFMTSGAVQMIIDSSGFVGIGTRNPIAKLHVDTGGLMISNGATALANPAIQVVNNGGGPGNNDNIVINSFGVNTQPSIGTQSSRGTFSAPQNSQAGDNIGNFFFNARVNGNIANCNVIRGAYLGDGTNNKSRLNILTSNSVAMSIDSNQFVGIGTTSPAYRLHVIGDINASNNVRAGGVVLTSDVRLKRNISHTQHGLSTVMALNPVEYDKKNSIEETNYNRHEIGFIAQEIAKVLPSIVTEGKDVDKTLAVSYTELIPVLTKAIQEQQAQIEALQAENQKLKNTEAVTAQLMERVKQMEQMMGVKEIEGTSKVAGK